MKSTGTPRFWHDYARLPASVKEHARAAYRLFRDNPDHPGLNFEHIVGAVYTARVSRQYRVVGTRDGDEMLWFWIGTHAEYDRLIG